MLTLRVPTELRFLLPPAGRTGMVPVAAAVTDTVGHVVQAAGIPLTEVEELELDGTPVPASTLVVDGNLALKAIVRPQDAPTSPPRFLLDVHLGGLARRLRLLGLVRDRCSSSGRSYAVSCSSHRSVRLAAAAAAG